MRKYLAEFFGTFVLVLFGTGIAVVSGGDLVATSLAFGLAIVAGAYSIGDISGCHVNPAVSLAMLMQGKLDGIDFCGYVIAQLLGALGGSAMLVLILTGTDLYGTYSANNISLIGALATEVILTAIFVYTILGVTSDSKYSSVSGIVIGLTLTFVHLLGIPLTGTSVNPARSLAPALLQRGVALNQVWVFIVGPLLGGALAAIIHKYINCEGKVSKKKTK